MRTPAHHRENVLAERKRVPVGATVRHQDGPEDSTGKVMKHITASVGAPSMARVAWHSGNPEGTAVNTRNLIVVK